MARGKQYELAVKIAGKVDSSFKGAIGEAQSTLSKFGSAVGGMAKVGAAALAAATTAAVAFAKSSVDAGMQFDSAMSQVAATMGTTVDQIGDLRNFAMEMGSKTAFSATEAAEALNYMALAGYDAQTSMAMLPNVLNLAAAGGIDLAAASDMITDAQSALGLTLEETSVMVDQMAKTSSKTNTSVEQLGDAILTVGGTAQYMAGGTAELNSVLGVLADNGIKGSEGGTHLRNMLLKLASPTTDAQKLLDNLGVSVFDAEGNMRSFAEIFPELNAAMANMTDQERLDAMSTLFNSRDIASATALLSTTTERWDELAVEIGNAQGAAEAMANTQLDNLQGDITLFKSALEGAQITLSDQLTPTLRGFVQFGTNGIAELTTAFQEGGLSGAMEALGGILSDGINMIIEQTPAFIDAGMKLLGALGQGLLDNLPVILDAAIQIVLMLIGGLIDALPVIAEAALEIITTLAFGIADALPTLIPSIIDVLLKIVDVLTDPGNIKMLVTAALAIIKALGRGLIDALPGLVQKIPEIITNIVTALTNSIPLIVETGVELFVALVQNLPAILAGIIQAVPQIITGIIDSFGSLHGDLAAVFSDAWEGVKSIFSLESVSGYFSTIWQGICGAFSHVTEWFSGVFTDAWEGVKNVFSTGGEIFTGIVDGILDGFKVVVNGIIGGINDVIVVPFNGINSALRSIRNVEIVGVHPFSWIKEISIPQIPQLAKGGVVDQPTILEAGEAGTEAIIPLAKLWTQMREMVTETVGDLIREIIQALDGAPPDGSAPVFAGGGPGWQITYRPEYHFDGGAPSKEDLVEAERISQEEFDQKMRQWIKDRDRKTF